MLFPPTTEFPPGYRILEAEGPDSAAGPPAGTSVGAAQIGGGPDVLEGRIEPGRVFDRTGSLDEVPEGYRLMNEREVLKFQIKP